MSADTFRGSARPSLGVELELQLVDARSMALTGAVDEILAEVPVRLRDSVKPEFYDSCVEVNTDICRDVAEVERDLTVKLAVATQIAQSHGVVLAWGGTHPFSHWREQPVYPTPRYHELARLYRDTLCRQLTFGLHVHVGVEDGDTAVRVGNRMVEYLPALLSLSANSPFWCGRATGLHAHRVEVMEASPTGGLPPRLGGWGDFVRLVNRLTDAGLIRSSKDLWWDVRPSPDLGTVEVRMCDMPPNLPSVLSLTALIQCLVVALARGDEIGPASGPGLDECGRLIVRQDRWRAARFGLAAELIDPRTGSRSTAREMIKGLVERLRRVSEALGCARQLELARTLADGPDGAERQLAVFRRTGDLAAIVRNMAGATPESGHPAPSTHGRVVPGVDGPGARAVSWPGMAITPGARGPFAIS